jgi:hypothetical protein
LACDASHFEVAVALIDAGARSDTITMVGTLSAVF